MDTGRGSRIARTPRRELRRAPLRSFPHGRFSYDARPPTIPYGSLQRPRAQWAARKEATTVRTAYGGTSRVRRWVGVPGGL
ncbi:hypothetical protein GCM10022252_07070 [Streptosporangium oxazolinicum]|uniref:Uncharacterized protein n=1 Tax=Streptosporangium oxazolinicum TaxID=909287 RepID=A0ABP8AD40_9ACTN